MLLLVSWGRAYPGRLLGKLGMPLAEGVGGEVGNGKLAKGRQDVSGHANLYPIGSLSFTRQKLDIGADSVGDGVGSCAHSARARSPRNVHRLPIIEDRHAVGVGHVVGNADRLLVVPLLAEIAASDPRAGAVVAEASVPEVQTALDRSPIRLGSRL